MGDPLGRSDYVFLQGLLRDRIGHDLGEGKEYLVESRLRPLASSLGLEGLADLFRRLRLEADPALVASACEAMITGETSFFRNDSTFDRLRSTVLPALIEARGDERRLRIWSAGCSTGQEPYSVALLLLEHFLETRAWDVEILATDASREAIRRAELGSYNAQEISRGIDAATRRTHFAERDGRWWIGPGPRRLVRFRAHNLLDPPPISAGFDLILIRNVLIYFTAQARALAFGSLRRAIRDDGYLFLGESETILGQGTEFRFPEGGMDYYRPSIATNQPGWDS